MYYTANDATPNTAQLRKTAPGGYLHKIRIPIWKILLTGTCSSVKVLDNGIQNQRFHPKTRYYQQKNPLFDRKYFLDLKIVFTTTPTTSFLPFKYRAHRFEDSYANLQNKKLFHFTCNE